MNYRAHHNRFTARAVRAYSISRGRRVRDLDNPVVRPGKTRLVAGVTRHRAYRLLPQPLRFLFVAKAGNFFQEAN